MSSMGMAMMGTGESKGENRAVESAEKAISSPLLEDLSISGARGILINITASSDVTLPEINEAAELIHEEAHPDANIIWGMVIDENAEDLVRVTVIATGFEENANQNAGKLITPAVNAVQPNGQNAKSNGQSNGQSGVVKLKKYSVLSSSEDKFEIPTFLRKQAE